MKNTTFLALFTFLTTFSVQSQKLAYSFSEEYDIDKPTSLIISSSNSNITILSHNNNTIEVQYSVKKNGKLLSVDKSTLKDLIKAQSTLNVSHTANEMNIEVTKVVQNSYINSEDAIIIDFVLYVPKQTSCELESSDGDISLNGLNSNQKCITSDGNIKLSDLKGDVVAKTSDGNIFIQNVIGKVDSYTNDGKVIKSRK